MTEQSKPEQTQPNTSLDELERISQQLTTLNMRFESFEQGFFERFESAFEEALQKRRVMNEADITKLINARLADRVTRSEMDKRQIDMQASYNSALKQSIDSLLDALKKQIDISLKPILHHQVELDSKVNHSADDIKMLQDGHNKQQELYHTLNGILNPMGENIKELKNGFFGDGSQNLGLRHAVGLHTAQLVKAENDIKRLHTEQSEMGKLREDFYAYVKSQKERQEAMITGAKKFMKWVAPVALTAMIGSDIAGRFLLAVFNALGF